MTYWIGIDEAGYGPNLGPLVIAATTWEAEDGLTHESAWHEMSAVVASAEERAEKGSRHLVGDSKLVFDRSVGPASLAPAVHAALATCGKSPDSWLSFLDALGPNNRRLAKETPWLADNHQQLASNNNVRATTFFRAASMKLIDVSAIVVPAREFNRRLQHGNKSDLLTRASLSLLFNAASVLPSRVNVDGICDKHGGRSRYAAALLDATDNYADVLVESQSESRYRLSYQGRSFDIRFCRKGERFLMPALASMIAKYTRELAMERFNAFWCKHVPGISPTAGYPTDAKRFAKDIETARKEIDIPIATLWRAK